MAAVGPPASGGHWPGAAAAAAAGAGSGAVASHGDDGGADDPLSEVAPPPDLDTEVRRGHKRAMDVFYTTQRLQVPEFPEL